MFKRSCEDKKTIYLCFRGKRYVFYEFKYVGWYRPSEVVDEGSV